MFSTSAIIEIKPCGYEKNDNLMKFCFLLFSVIIHATRLFLPLQESFAVIVRDGALALLWILTHMLVKTPPIPYFLSCPLRTNVKMSPKTIITKITKNRIIIVLLLLLLATCPQHPTRRNWI